MNSEERFKIAYNYLRSKGKFHTQTDCGNLMDASRSNINRALHGDPIVLTNRFIKRFCDIFPEINIEWLLDETGDMIKSNNDESKTNIDLKEESNTDSINILIRHIDNLSKTLETEIERIQKRESLLDEREQVIYERFRKVESLIEDLTKLKNNNSNNYKYIDDNKYNMASEPFNELKTK